jgi:hypothetical protein
MLSCMGTQARLLPWVLWSWYLACLSLALDAVVINPRWCLASLRLRWLVSENVFLLSGTVGASLLGFHTALGSAWSQVYYVSSCALKLLLCFTHVECIILCLLWVLCRDVSPPTSPTEGIACSTLHPLPWVGMSLSLHMHAPDYCIRLLQFCELLVCFHWDPLTNSFSSHSMPCWFSSVLTAVLGMDTWVHDRLSESPSYGFCYSWMTYAYSLISLNYTQSKFSSRLSPCVLWSAIFSSVWPECTRSWYFLKGIFCVDAW